jgi:hypothetical protein
MEGVATDQNRTKRIVSDDERSVNSATFSLPVGCTKDAIGVPSPTEYLPPVFPLASEFPSPWVHSGPHAVADLNVRFYSKSICSPVQSSTVRILRFGQKIFANETLYQLSYTPVYR